METNVRLEATKIAVSPEVSVTGTVGIPAWWPSGHRVGVVLGHDVTSNLEHEFLVALHYSLAERGYLSLRFNFPFAEHGKKRPDPAPLLEKTFRSALASLMQDPQTAPARIVAGGFGLGARVASQVIAQGLLADGLICLGYPLHPSGKPNQQKADALFRIICPMLFIQGARDPYCRVDRLSEVLRRIGAPTRLHVVEDGDHGLGLIKRSTRTPGEVKAEILAAVESFLKSATNSG